MINVITISVASNQRKRRKVGVLTIMTYRGNTGLEANIQSGMDVLQLVNSERRPRKKLMVSAVGDLEQ